MVFKSHVWFNFGFELKFQHSYKITDRMCIGVMTIFQICSLRGFILSEYLIGRHNTYQGHKALLLCRYSDFYLIICSQFAFLTSAVYLSIANHGQVECLACQTTVVIQQENNKSSYSTCLSTLTAHDLFDYHATTRSGKRKSY